MNFNNYTLSDKRFEVLLFKRFCSEVCSICLFERSVTTSSIENSVNKLTDYCVRKQNLFLRNQTRRRDGCRGVFFFPLCRFALVCVVSTVLAAGFRNNWTIRYIACFYYLCDLRLVERLLLCFSLKTLSWWSSYSCLMRGLDSVTMFCFVLMWTMKRPFGSTHVAPGTRKAWTQETLK